MARHEQFAGIDIGSTAIRVVVGQRRSLEDPLEIIAASEHPSEGISKGVLTSIEDATSSISAALEKTERMSGSPIESVSLALSGAQTMIHSSKGVAAIAKASGEISEDDVMRATESAEAVAAPPNYKLLHLIPKSFTVDGQSGIKDPIGMTGTRLEVEAQVIHALSSHIENVSKCVLRAGVDIHETVLGILACAESVTTSRQKELGVAVVNIGAQTTSIAVFEEGDLLHSAVIPVGAGHFTNDVAIGLRISIDLAEKIKLSYGTAVPSSVSKHEEVDLSEFGPESTDRVSHRHVAEIIEARLEEIFSMVNKEFAKIHRVGLLPAGVVFSGGGSKLPGILEVAKKELKLPASIGSTQILTAIDKVNDPQFSTAVGLVLWDMRYAAKGLTSRGLGFGKLPSITNVAGKVRKWAKSLMP